MEVQVQARLDPNGPAGPALVECPLRQKYIVHFQNECYILVIYVVKSCCPRKFKILLCMHSHNSLE
jgi:hypothetical protein